MARAPLSYHVGVRQFITEADVPKEGSLRVVKGTRFTHAALELIRAREVCVEEVNEHAPGLEKGADRTVAVGSDHGGFHMKERLKPTLEELGWAVADIGVFEEKPADYPDIAHEVARRVAEGKAALGVIVDGAGIGSAMAANKVPGVRAALCYDRASARNSREHNHANVLTLGGRLLTESQAEEVLRTWLATPFGGGRHQGRIDKITEIERRYSTWTAQNSKNS
jgi:ribose 5-phosphate isomerase B